MLRSAAALALLALAVPATAEAAPKAGSYKGTSSGEVQAARDDAPRTDRGVVRLKVAGRSLTSLVLSGQEFSCGGQTPEVPIRLGRTRLSSAGTGRARFRDPSVGAFDVTVTVTSRGRASGTVVARGLCRGTARFTARRA